MYRPAQFQWGNQQINKKHIDDTEKQTVWKTPDPKQTTKMGEAKILFSDDTGVAFKRPQDTLPKLQTYGQITKKPLVNWEEVFAIANKYLPPFFFHSLTLSFVWQQPL